MCYFYTFYLIIKLNKGKGKKEEGREPGKEGGRKKGGGKESEREGGREGGKGKGKKEEQGGEREKKQNCNHLSIITKPKKLFKPEDFHNTFYSTI